MATVFDVAAYILDRQGPMTAMKLQKLAYYSQAWSLVWDDAPLFQNSIEAWANGPVSPDLYKAHAGDFMVSRINGSDLKALNDIQRETVEAVLRDYGDKSSDWLGQLTHVEQPWLQARGETPPGQRSTAEITQAAMAEFYGSL